MRDVLLRGEVLDGDVLRWGRDVERSGCGLTRRERCVLPLSLSSELALRVERERMDRESLSELELELRVDVVRRVRDERESSSSSELELRVDLVRRVRAGRESSSELELALRSERSTSTR